MHDEIEFDEPVSAEADNAPEVADEPATHVAVDTIERPDAPSPGIPKLTVARLSLANLGLAKRETTMDAEATAAEAPVEAPEAAAEVAPEEEIETRVAVEPEPEPVAEPEAMPVTAPATFSKENVLHVEGLTKSFDEKLAVDQLDLTVNVGAFYGIVGPNGAGKTTTLSMMTGLLRPDSGTVHVYGAEVWDDPVVAKRNMGVLPDRLKLFERLTGAQALYYAGVLRGLDEPTVRKRTTDLAAAFGIEDSLGRLVTDYSAGMTKKVALAAAMIHSPRLLVLDEPFESVDPVSAATVTEILKNYVNAGGTVVLSSHSMDLVQRICDHVAVIVNGVVLADGTMDEVRAGRSLEERFVELAGGRKHVEGLEWLHSFSD